MKSLSGNNSSNTYGIDITNSGNGKNDEIKGNKDGSFCC